MINLRVYEVTESDGKPSKKVDVYNSDGSVKYSTYVHRDNSGNEYFYAKNPKRKFGTFNGYVKDAIDCIRAGDGDVLQVTHLFGTSEHVLCFINRNIGEAYRAKTIEGFKDAVFKYAIRYGDPSSMNGQSLMSTDYQYFFNTFNDLMKFDTEDEAQKCIDDITKVVLDWAKKYKSSSTEAEQSKIIDEFEEKYDPNKVLNAYMRAFFFATEDDFIERDMQSFFKVVQTIDQKKENK